MQEAVCRDELHLRMIRPARHQRTQDTGERTLADSDAAGDADDVGRVARRPAEERVLHPRQTARRRDMQVQQTGVIGR